MQGSLASGESELRKPGEVTHSFSVSCRRLPGRN